MKFISLFVIIFLLFFPLLVTAQEGTFEEAPSTEGTPSMENTPEDVSATEDASPREDVQEPVEEPVKTESPVVENAPAHPDVGAVETIVDMEDMVAADVHPMGFAARLGFALGIIAGSALLIWLTWQFFKFLAKKVTLSAGDKIKPLTIKKLKLLTAKQILEFLLFGLKIVKYLVTAIQLFLTLPIVFYLFPKTRNFAMSLFDHILSPLKKIVFGIVGYVPNLITIIIIIVITHYALKGLKFFSTQISRGRLVIPGFYADWAAPTYKILQVLLIAFTVALVYPYLPGADSRVFQGVSVFVGIIFSLGSSSAIGNLVAGLVITYMRPFKIGDRVKINDSTGFVVEKNLMVVRLKTHKNEYVTFPNLLILNSGIINYNTSSDEDEEGLILNTEITVGYATPWEKVHELLIDAALKTDYVLKKPKPFVLQTSLDDFYARYQVNCYTKEVDRIPNIYANLYENIQSNFSEACIDLTSPNFEISIQKK
jgi:small-conductance mechanosensitive channel